MSFGYSYNVVCNVSTTLLPEASKTRMYVCQSLSAYNLSRKTVSFENEFGKSPQINSDEVLPEGIDTNARPRGVVEAIVQRSSKELMTVSVGEHPWPSMRITRATMVMTAFICLSPKREVTNQLRPRRWITSVMIDVITGSAIAAASRTSDN